MSLLEAILSIKKMFSRGWDVLLANNLKPCAVKSSKYRYNFWGHDDSVSAIFVVLSKGVEIINYPSEINKQIWMNLLEVILFRKKKFSRGVGCHPGTWLKTMWSSKQ